jgi:hypothetical protein
LRIKFLPANPELKSGDRDFPPSCSMNRLACFLFYEAGLSGFRNEL